MKFSLIFVHLLLIIMIIEARRPYTTPSPYGTFHIKQIKCSCNELFFQYFYRNLSCFAKAHNRDLTTGTVYVKLKKDITKIWVSAYLEYKYGTIYRRVITTKKIEACEEIRNIESNRSPIIKIAYTYAQMIVPEMIHLCPYKAGEEVYGYNKTVDPKYMPSIFNQGDYRGAIQLFLERPDQLVCNDTLYVSIISPIKDSFGKK